MDMSTFDAPESPEEGMVKLVDAFKVVETGKPEDSMDGVTRLTLPGKTIPPVDYSYTTKDSILYSLGCKFHPQLNFKLNFIRS